MRLTSILRFRCVVHSSKIRSFHEGALRSTNSDLQSQISNTNLSQDQTVQNNINSNEITLKHSYTKFKGKAYVFSLIIKNLHITAWRSRSSIFLASNLVPQFDRVTILFNHQNSLPFLHGMTFSYRPQGIRLWIWMSDSKGCPSISRSTKIGIVPISNLIPKLLSKNRYSRSTCVRHTYRALPTRVGKPPGVLILLVNHC